MATKKTAVTKATVSPEPDEQLVGGGVSDPAVVVLDDVPGAAPAPAPAAAPAGTGAVAPAPAPAAVAAPTAGGGFHSPSSIAVPVGSSGYYTGARPAETLAQYDARLGAAANTFADLGWLVGTKPNA